MKLSLTHGSLLTSGRTIRVTAPHFVAGVVETQDGVIITTAPILKWAGGWASRAFKDYCLKKGWKVEYCK